MHRQNIFDQRWFKDNIFDIQCQKLLKSERVRLKLYKMAQFIMKY